ncbi:MAG TPA: toprim domain-containing protein [Candidatus Faecousia intestinigallinarum]|nr:toprim domain-containing protein [Candidatus Faecousia intestinigallinarum]
MIIIQIRKVDPAYLNFLREHDSHVPEKENRPWLWPIRIHGIDYGIPLTTQSVGAGQPGFLRCGAMPDTGAYLRFMIPIPQSALLPPEPMSPKWQQALLYYERMRKYIQEEAQILHRLNGEGMLDQFWDQHSCNFQKLDMVFSQWTPGENAGYFLYPKEEPPMPVSKNGKLYYTKEQYDYARFSVSALEYAQSRGYDLVKEKNYYRLREHDSMVFTPSGRWFWNSRGLSGGAIEFMVYYEDKTLTEAVLTLAGNRSMGQDRQTRQDVPLHTAPAQQVDTKPAAFRLPRAAANMKQLFYYLCVVRGLEKSVVKEMIAQKRLYQSMYQTDYGKILNHAAFVYRDSQGNAVGAYQRGMAEPRPGQAPYKRDAPGSDKRWGWLLQSPFHPATEVRVFEAAIDAASDASLCALASAPRDWRQEPVDRLSLEGTWHEPLECYLEGHPQVHKITLMLDGDDAGRRATQQIAERLQGRGLDLDVREPAVGMDWNETLLSQRQATAEQQTQHPQMQQAKPSEEMEL